MSELKNLVKAFEAVENHSPALSPVAFTSLAASFGELTRNTTKNASNRYVAAFFRFMSPR